MWAKQKTQGAKREKHGPQNQHRGYFTTGPNKDHAVLIWHHRVVAEDP